MSKELNIKEGDKVDFGPYGVLYVVGDYDEKNYWVTDEKKHRKNPDAPGWVIRKSYAEKKVR